MQQVGLGDQNFAQNAALANLHTQNAMAMNQANLQTQADFIPVLSEAQYQAQQQLFAGRSQALQEAMANGTIDQPTLENAQQQLLAQQVGLRSMMPTQSDISNQFARSTYSDPDTGMRYLYNSQAGGFVLDPGVQAQIANQRYQNNVASQVYRAGQAQMQAFAQQVQQAQQLIIQSSGGKVSPQAAYVQAYNQTLQVYQQQAGLLQTAA
jgi:hypothetical protein